jgi:hypothetical protein
MFQVTGAVVVAFVAGAAFCWPLRVAARAVPEKAGLVTAVTGQHVAPHP